MTLVIELIEFFVVFAAALTFIGFGITHLVLPISLWRWRWLAMPLVGYCFTLLFFRIVHTYLLTGAQCTWTLLLLALIINAGVLIRKRRVLKWPSWKELAPVLIAAVIFCVAVYPLLTYGYSTVIGTNGDIDYYLGSAEYIRDFSASNLSLAPTSVFFASAMSVAMHPLGGAGCSYALSMIATLLNWSVLSCFAPTLAFFWALSIIAFSLFTRSVLGLSKFMTVFACLVLGLNGLILWSAFFNYGHHMSALPLLPLAIVALRAFWKRPGWKSCLFLGLVFCALVISYWIATIWVLISAVVFLVLHTLRRRQALSKASVMVAVLIVGFFPFVKDVPAYVGKAFQIYVSDPGASIFEQYFSIEHLFGLKYYVWPAPEPVDELLGPVLARILGSAEVVLLVLSLFLGTIALWYSIRKKRYAALSIVVASVVLLGVTQFGSQDRYGYLKAMVFATFVAVAMTVWGLELAWRHISLGGIRWIRVFGKAGLVVFGVALLAVNGANAYMTVGHFIDSPKSPYAGRYADIVEVNSLLEPRASIYLTDDLRLNGWAMSPITYALYPHPQNGLVETPNSPKQQVGKRISIVKHLKQLSGAAKTIVEPYLSDYAVLAAREDPLEKGYQNTDLIWGNEAIRVYKRGSVVAHVDFDRAFGGSVINRKQPVKMQVNIPTDQSSPQAGGAQPEDGVKSYGLVLEFSSLVDQQIQLDLSGQKITQQLGPGMWRYHTTPVNLPVTVTISTTSSDPLLLHWVQLRSEADSADELEKVDSYVVARSSSVLTAQDFTNTLHWIGPRSQSLPGLLEMRVRKADSSTPGKQVAAWPVDGDFRDAKIALDKANGVIQAYPAGSDASPLTWQPDQGDGYYLVEVRSFFAEAEADSEKYQPWSEIFRYALQDGKVIDISGKDGPLPPRYVPLDTWHPINAGFGEVADMRGYSINTDVFRTGRDTNHSLYWYMPKGFAREWNVSLQLVDAQGKVWSEKVVNLSKASSFQDSWSEAETLRTDFALPIGRDVPEGQYNLRVKMYYSYQGDSLIVQAPDRVPSNALDLGPFTVKIPIYMEGR